MAEFGAEVGNWVPPPRPDALRLDGAFVRVEPLTAAHAPALHAANRVDDAIWDYLPYGPFAAEADYRAWVERMAGQDDPRFFALIDRATGLPGGVASLMRIDPAAGSIEVGHICLSPALQRTPAASEMIFLFADWAFGAGYRRFEWKCDALNQPSRRAAERFGFSYEGVFRQAAVVKGRNRDTAWFAMIDKDWPGLRAGYAAWLDPGNFDAEGRQRRRLGDLTAPHRVASDPAIPGLRREPAVMEFLLRRRSKPAKTIRAPGPGSAELERLLTAALRVPDHGKLEPWRLIVLERAGLARFAAAIRTRAAETGADADKGALVFEQVPVTVAVVASPVAAKVPAIEQTLSAGAVCLGLLNAAEASGWAAAWLSGWPAYDPDLLRGALGLAEAEWIAGFVHLGTSDAAPPDRPRPEVGRVVTWIDA